MKIKFSTKIPTKNGEKKQINPSFGGTMFCNKDRNKLSNVLPTLLLRTILAPNLKQYYAINESQIDMHTVLWMEVDIAQRR